MRYRKKSHNDDADVDMTPMLDIVFIMLIFFIVTAVFLDETGINLREAPDVEPPDSSEPAILVQLNEQDMAFIEGEAISLSAVPARVQAMRAQAPTSNVSLQAEPDASINAVVFLKDQMDAANVPITIKVDP